MIDNSKWAMNALNFEMIFSKQFPKFKSEKNSLFAKTKKEIIDFLAQEKYSCNEDIQSIVNQFKNAIKQEGVLREKFNYFISEYEIELNPTIQLLKKTHNLGDDLGKQYANKRNGVMHGKLEQPSDADVGIYKLIRAMYYAYILRKADFESQKTADIVERLFARFN